MALPHEPGAELRLGHLTKPDVILVSGYGDEEIIAQVKSPYLYIADVIRKLDQDISLCEKLSCNSVIVCSD